MAFMMSNLAFNPMKSMTSFGDNMYKGVKGDHPLSYAFRTRDARDRYEASKHIQGSHFNPKEHEWAEGSLSKRRVAVGALGAYGLADGAYRIASGGSVYQNHTGRKDLVGIPMI